MLRRNKRRFTKVCPSPRLAAALLASMFISGRSAVMTEGQTVDAFTDETIAY